MEAEKAAKALEVAATKSPIARASLMETRKLIAEAIQSMESIETSQATPLRNDGCPSVASNEQINQVEKDTSAEIKGSNQAELGEVNGTRVVPTKDKDFNFSNYGLHDFLNNEDQLLPTSFRDLGLSPFSFESLMKQSDSRNRHELPEQDQNSDYEDEAGFLKEETPPESVTLTKKWVRGRLIEVAEGA